MKTNIKAEIISKDIINVGNSYYCSEDHIQEINKADPKLLPTRGDGHMDYGYGNCTKDGWLRWIKEVSKKAILIYPHIPAMTIPFLHEGKDLLPELPLLGLKLPGYE